MSIHHIVLTFHLGLVLPKCVFLSWFPTEILCVFLISPVRFSCPICPTVFQFTTHQKSVTSTNHAAPHCRTLFIPLLLPLPSQHISPLAPVLTKFSFFFLWNTKRNIHFRTHLIICKRYYLFIITTY